MSDSTGAIRLSKAAREFNIGVTTVIDFLGKRGFKLGNDPNGKLTQEMYGLLLKEFASEKHVKEEAKKIGLQFNPNETITIDSKKTAQKDADKDLDDLFIKNVALGYEKKVADQVKPKEAAPKETKKAEPKPEPETKAVAKKAAEKPEPKEKAEAEPEPAETEEPPVAKTKKKEEKPAEEPKAEEKPVEEKARPGKELVILGKIDIEALEKKPSRKGKEKAAEPEKPAPKAKGKAKKEETPEIPVPEPVAETETPPVVVEEVVPEPVAQKPAEPDNIYRREKIILEGPTILGTIVLPEPRKPADKKKPVASSSDDLKSKKKKRKRIRSQGSSEVPATETKPDAGKGKFPGKKFHKDIIKPEISQEDIQRHIKETLSRLSPSGKSKASKHRRMKRDAVSQQLQEEAVRMEEGKKVIQVTEFVTANELATMMNVNVTEVISTCMALGLFVSINQRLDAETLAVVAEEFGYKLEFVSVEVQEAIKHFEEEDNPEEPDGQASHRYRHGSRRPRKDQTPRLHPQLECGGG